MNAQADMIDTHGLRGSLQPHLNMAEHVSWRAGGRAEYGYVPQDSDDLIQFLRRVPTDMPVHSIGLGSNVLVRDGGLAGVVILMHGALRHLHMDSHGDDYGVVYAEAGVALPKLGRFAAKHELSGSEFMAGIPGTVGGALAMNAGCYGSETWQTVARVLTVNRHGSTQLRERAEFSVGYREVTGLAQDEWFLAGWFTFPSGNGAQAQRAIAELLQRRIASQPLNQPNAGSVFRNPPNDHAARLIELCGLKGKQIGGAQVSLKHANFIVNTGTATAADIESLIEAVRSEVYAQQGVALLSEVRVIGQRLGGSA